MRLKDKVVLVTASTRGIGLAIVKKCAEEGAKVYMAARDMEQAQKIANTLNGVKCVYNDATKPETFTAMVEDVVGDTGRIDVLVNNFGTSNPGKDLDFANTDPLIFLNTVTLNLRSVFMASQAAAKHMEAQGGGSIINISSVGGLVPDISQVAYGTSKAAINYLTKLIAVQEANHHVRCNAVLPGMTATEAVEKHLSNEFRDLFMRHIPLGRMGLPEEIAEAVCYFASDASAYTTGQILTVSGGFGLATPVYGDLANKSSRR
ncbi:MAG: SDR family oxidoreductase [Oscillospiraceae bacterium]|jgi:NAD(P)-dependent dehydrogenase (short-subunit alcohol dehydrogenase family)|nr:SDR family oxidoreductase [Oscillospiraceae bacterium]